MDKIEKTEGDVNLSEQRKRWIDNNLDDAAKLLLEEDSKYFLHQSLSTPCLNAIDSCNGSFITDLQGRKFLDFHGNNVHQVGYGNVTVLDAVKRAIEELPFSPRRYTNKYAVNFAKKLVELAPGNLNKVLFAPSGALANGIALKLSRIATGRFKTVSWWDSFHGAGLDTISIGGEALFRKKIGPLLPGSIHVPPPDTYRNPIGNFEYNSDIAFQYLEYVFEHEQDIAAFIAEPIRYTNSVIPPKDYWVKVRELCDKYGALLIFDEIPTCLGRTGFMFVNEYYGVTPDIVTLGKGLGGGVFPMAALIAREELDIAGDIALGHYTHEKSPVGSAAGLAAIEVIEKENLLERVKAKGKYFLQTLRQMQDYYEFIGDVRGLGFLIGVELVKDRTSKERAEELTEKILYKALEMGLSFKVSSGNVLSLMPPLTITDDEIDSSLDILVKCFNSI